MALSIEEVRAFLAPYGISASRDLCASIQNYISLLLRWNNHISLTTVTDQEEIVRFHFGESFFAAGVVPIRDGRLADVGSGAGFPGLALRIAVPALQVTLIESNGKKATFLSEVTRDLKLDHTTVVRMRMEEVRGRENEFDFVTSRALGRHGSLLGWAKDTLTRNGRVVLWLGEDDCSRISKQLTWKWRDPIHIPGSKRRFLLVGSKDS
jgi:16S rRNA (guanine527-N7)-methyltransferase